MPDILHYLPELQENERAHIEALTNSFSHEQVQTFASVYRQQRKDPQTVLLAAIVGVVAVPGLQRFWVGQVGLGLLFLFTWGFFLVGSVVDLVQYKQLAIQYNQQVAQRIVANMQTSSQQSPLTIGRSLFQHA
jgi:hypothetical protein